MATFKISDESLWRRLEASPYKAFVQKLASSMETEGYSQSSARWVTRSTQPYLHAHIAIKEAALARLEPVSGQAVSRFKADDQLLAFLDSL